MREAGRLARGLYVVILQVHFDGSSLHWSRLGIGWSVASQRRVVGRQRLVGRDGLDGRERLSNRHRGSYQTDSHHEIWFY